MTWYRKLCNRTLTLKQPQKAELAYKRKHGCARRSDARGRDGALSSTGP
jgi:hypothetical protein